MISKDQIFVVRVTDDIIIPAVTYAERSLHFTYNRMTKGDPYDRIRNIVKGIIMEGAFKKLLDHHNVKYDLKGATHWTRKDRYDIRIKGSKYDVKGAFINDPAHQREIGRDIGWFLDCTALVPADQLEARTFVLRDKYIFPFMTGTIIRGVDDFNRVSASHRERYFIHIFKDKDWFNNNEWKALGEITLQCKMNENVTLRLIGQDAAKEAQVETISMEASQALKAKSEFYTLLSSQTQDIPTGKLDITALVLHKTEQIEKRDWQNIWVYDGLVYFSGFINKGEFMKKSRLIKKHSKECKQYKETKTNNRGLPVRQLYPLTSILPKKYENYIP